MAAGEVVAASDFRNGVVGRGNRQTPSGATITTEVGYLRVDGLTLYAARSYKIWTSPLALKGSVVGDIAEACLRVNTGGTATTSSTQVAHVRQYTDVAATPDLTPIAVHYTPGADTSTFSVLLSVVRNTAGGASTGVRLTASATEPVDLVVEDIGPVVADTGVDI